MMKRSDRNEKPGQQNGMMLAELKHLKATLAAKDKRIAELEKQVKDLRALVPVPTLTSAMEANVAKHGSVEAAREAAKDVTLGQLLADKPAA
jgi:hypothetical protein